MITPFVKEGWKCIGVIGGDKPPRTPLQRIQRTGGREPHVVERAGNIAGERNGNEDGGNTLKTGGKGFGFDIRKFNVRPSNTSIKDTL